MCFLKLINTYSAIESRKFRDILSYSDDGSNLWLSPSYFDLFYLLLSLLYFCIHLQYIFAVWFRAGSGGGCTTGKWWSTCQRTDWWGASSILFLPTFLSLDLPRPFFVGVDSFLFSSSSCQNQIPGFEGHVRVLEWIYTL